ncbi:MAG: cell division protein 48 (CDC48), domain 2, partial [halophilic archaeon J07HB67]
MTTTDHTGTVVGVTDDTEGVVRLAGDDAAAAGLSDDTPVVVRGDDETAARVTVDTTLAARSVVVDESVADGADAGVGDTVTITPTDPQTATGLRFAPVPDLSIRGGESAVRRAAAGTPLVVGDRITVSLFNGALDVPVRVTATEPDGPVYATDETAIELVAGPATAVAADHRVPHVPEADVGGYDDVRTTLER